MSSPETLAEQFESNREHLKSVAYRMLGSLSEADDAVQETWLRLNRSGTDQIENLRAWLTTVVSRICLDTLRSRKIKREESLEAHFTDTFESYDAESSPEAEALLADSVGVALLVVLDHLKPSERITFVLHDIFSIPFNKIASILGKSEIATRKIASRARRRVHGADTRKASDFEHKHELVDAFLTAARKGDFDRLLDVLHPNVVLRDDRQTGTIRTTKGAKALANQVIGRAQAAQIALINGSIGVIAAPYGKLLYSIQFKMTKEKITEIDLISSPTRLKELEIEVVNL
ncbi:sigma-70 family RNA polymerase sigma factor [Bacillus horti]|uniref:RNA polymerase sigma-70 factor (ECF subfamily) n=1 Tax=Caldalkalibacillus horti TaxID=77523 RepID=A0ABT9VYF6_9BACI|nr:sigma-70 family RNA polymerase sigma factor [Bacillus horti]MDQ0166002.1 RNA polymerase sigma-70 factor (ECF subfamily) [Bacillus horti]